ncbi:MAG: DNA-binding response regulator [Rariglobus sp.]|jgi:two-component system response regulator DevR|nr:DNA-binding response regulator [Rariglobus sp.]
MNQAPSSPPVRLVLADDSELVRVGLQTLLQGAPGIELCGVAATAAEALAVCRRARPDVVLLDIRLPDGTGIDVCRALLAEGGDTRVLFLTSSSEQDVVDEAIRAGAHGYLLKEINTPALLQGIRDVAAGRSILDPQITARVMDLLKNERNKPLIAGLSPQEQRVLAKIAEGCTNKEVAADLGLSEKTVKNYLSNIFEKLHFSRRSQAAAYYTQSVGRASGPNGPSR